MLKYDLELRVQYFETDKMQFVHHSRYVEYFERARTEMLRHYGLPYSVIEENGYQMPVLEINIKYKNAAFYDDVLIVETSLENVSSPKIKILYKVYKKGTDIICAEGFTTLTFVSMELKRAVRPPDFYVEMIKKHITELLNVD